ncbi:MAG: hypothetical protein JXL84_09285 [Deltaproteobacteria bacterium]|nr:hypothetical protein [Deltaproteobacteria bacterium]
MRDKRRVMLDVKRILSEGDKQTVKAFLLNVAAYLDCVETCQRFREMQREVRRYGNHDE